MHEVGQLDHISALPLLAVGKPSPPDFTQLIERMYLHSSQQIPSLFSGPDLHLIHGQFLNFTLATAGYLFLREVLAQLLKAVTTAKTYFPVEFFVCPGSLTLN